MRVCSSLVSFVEVRLALNNTHVACFAQAPAGHWEQMVHTPAEGRSSISKAVQHIAIHIHFPEQGGEVVNLCLQPLPCAEVKEAVMWQAVNVTVVTLKCRAALGKPTSWSHSKVMRASSCLLG